MKGLLRLVFGALLLGSLPAAAAPLRAGSAATYCSPSATTLCLDDYRFAVTANWASSNGGSGTGNAVALTSDTGYFWFFDAANIEVTIKVLDACSLNGHFWVFASGLTNTGVVLTVTDMATGAYE